MPLGIQLRQVTVCDEPVRPIKHWHEGCGCVCLHTNEGSEDPSNRGLANTFPGAVHDDESAVQLGTRATKPSPADY